MLSGYRYRIFYSDFNFRVPLQICLTLTAHNVIVNNFYKNCVFYVEYICTFVDN